MQGQAGDRWWQEVVPALSGIHALNRDGRSANLTSTPRTSLARTTSEGYLKHQHEDHNQKILFIDSPSPEPSIAPNHEHGLWVALEEAIFPESREAHQDTVSCVTGNPEPTLCTRTVPWT